MSEPIIFPLPDGATYVIPDVDDENWGQNVTDFLVAIPAGVLPRSGSYAFTGDVTITGGFGFALAYIKSQTSNVAEVGFIRLAKTDSIDWRNNANSANLPLAINGSDQLTFNGLVVGNASSVSSVTGTAHQILASPTTGAVLLTLPQDIDSLASPTFTGLTLSSLSDGVAHIVSNVVTSSLIVNADITNTTIDLTSKVTGILPNANTTAASSNTPSAIVTRDGSGDFSAGAITASLTGHASLDLALTGGTMSGAIAMGSNKITGVTQGTTSGDAISFPIAAAQITNNTITATQIANGTIGTTQIAANAVTQNVGSASVGTNGTTTDITTVTITGTGGPILLLGMASISAGASNANLNISLVRGSTQIGPDSSAAQGINVGNTVFNTNINYIDNPGAGTFTYHLKYTSNSGGVSSINGFSLQAIELKR